MRRIMSFRCNLYSLCLRFSKGNGENEEESKEVAARRGVYPTKMEREKVRVSCVCVCFVGS